MPNVGRNPSPAFPDSLGALFEASGWPRLAGRVVGELMLADPPYLSTSELCERIGTSKSHLSSAITYLEALHMLDRFGRPGTRQSHYRLRDNAFLRAFDDMDQRSRALAATADRALADVPPESRAAAELTWMRDLYRYLARRLPEMVREFEDGAR